jgi:ubiquinone/menaquinone biosynthesis C-methylase UbiE
MNLFFEIHRHLPREGSGDNQYTKKIFLSLNNLPKQPLILDIGCGPGIQTLELARNTKGKIIATDTHEPHLKVLNKKIAKADFSGRVKIQKLYMFSLTYPKNSFDVI